MNVASYLFFAVAIAVSGYAVFALWSHAPWKTAHELPTFNYSQDCNTDWEAELGEIASPGVASAWKQTRIITHALGRIDQHAYTNSKEALVANYKRGARVFEVDLLLTGDGRLVCAHDWKRFSPDGKKKNHAVRRTLAVFQQAKVYGKYTPISFRDLARMMKQCPDVFIVTDTKKDSPHLVRKAFAAMVADAKSIDEKILDRVIPQLYYPSMIKEVEKIHTFKEYIYTGYKRPRLKESQIIALIEKHPSVTVVTTKISRVSASLCEQLKKRNVRAFTHPVNSIEDMKRFAALGIDGFYSFDLLDEDVRRAGVFDVDASR
jgi:glycerophosphoryl diester phosphodiesterase